MCALPICECPLPLRRRHEARDRRHFGDVEERSARAHQEHRHDEMRDEHGAAGHRKRDAPDDDEPRRFRGDHRRPAVVPIGDNTGRQKEDEERKRRGEPRETGDDELLGQIGRASCRERVCYVV